MPPLTEADLVGAVISVVLMWFIIFIAVLVQLLRVSKTYDRDEGDQ